MKITFLVPTLTRFDLLDRLIVTLNNQTRKADELLIIDNSNGQCYKYPNAKIISTHNKGVAGAWNIGLKEADPDGLLVICNDDNSLYPYALQELENMVKENPTHPFFGSAGNGFSFFAIRPKLAIKTVGYFDEGFYPAYYEDNDYHYRMKLQNIDFICSDKQLYEMGLNGNSSQTLNGSQTPQQIKDYINAGFLSNQYRYICKWGGLPNNEKFIIPFNQK